ncbi:hypothetical protein AX14_014151 [Amanita brunnescens Koide BX004]|nr:hypothetical protein AX14_014151 [Amanita brunnescens Koide BX004]
MKHATIDAGVTLASFVAESRELGLHSTACAFDIAQFFPSLSHTGCTLILERFGFNRLLVNMFKSYFNGRITRYKWDSATSADFNFDSAPCLLLSSPHSCFVHSSLPPAYSRSPSVSVQPFLSSSLLSSAPDMVLPTSGPPGLPRPKSSPTSPSLLAHPPHSTGHIFSPAPSKPSGNHFQALFSPNPSPVPFLQPNAVALHATTQQPSVAMQSADRLPSEFLNNATIVNIAPSQTPCASINDPWTRAHMRACAHASDACAACSIALVCCSCRALRYTPGSPPSSPTVSALHVTRSRSASPALFRNIGNGPSPPSFDHDLPEHDDEAYARAFAECDTCDNSSCPRGVNEPASWTITVEQFDEGSEEFYDRTFRACAACNRSCRKTFMTYKIKARHFDNSSKATAPCSTPATAKQAASPMPLEPITSASMNSAVAALSSSTSPPLPQSRPTTPLEVFSVIVRQHRISCDHPHSTCPVCSCGVLCCACKTVHTAPARLRLCCTHCQHFACGTCITAFCCSCRKPWFPGDSPSLVLANRFRGGARSTKSSKKGSSASSSSSSGPGSLATAHSERASPDPFAILPPPPANPTQSSNDEIDAFADATVRLTSAPAPPPDNRSVRAPSPSSNLVQSGAPVFSRPPLPVEIGMTEDVPTAVPSRAPSRAASIVSAVSTGDAGIAELLQLDPFPTPSEPPAFADVIGRIHRGFPLASLKVDEEDPRHFLARDNTRADEIANDVDHLLSTNTSWASLFFFVRDILKFETIKGSASDFHAFLNGIADIWSDAADFDARGLISTALDAARYLPKAEKEIDRLEAVSARYRSERKSAREQLRTTEAELSRLRQAANDTVDSNARLLTEIDQLRATDAVTAVHERDEARAALNDVVVQSKAGMAKQVSRYQHLSKIADDRGIRIQELESEAKDKDAYILKTEREHAEIYREREAAERQVTTLKQQVHDVTLLFETAREARSNDQKDFDERAYSFKKHISELNSRLSLLPSGEAELRALVTDANERAGIAEEEYRKKSAEFKLVFKELESLKSKTKQSNDKSKQVNKPTPQLPSSKAVRWSFEPNDDLPPSQPFWDHSNEYSKYIASMVAATVTAIPNIPMQTAIATAIDTVRAAGPSVLGQNNPKAQSSKSSATPAKHNANTPTAQPLTKSSAAPSVTPPAPIATPKSRAASPSPAKPVTPAAMTFAQMAASVLDPPSAVPLHPAKAKPSWRAIETNKSLVLRPGTKGTRVSELHIRVPKIAATAHLFSLSGTKLINEVLRLVNESHNKAGIRALKENHLVLVKWSMRGNLIFKCSKPMDDIVKDCLHEAIKAAVPPNSNDSIAILNKPPTTALKFSSVPRHNEDGTDTDSYDLHNDLMSNELWRDVEIFSQPRFLPMKPDAAGGTVIVSVVDDNTGSVGRKLMNSVVSFSGASRRCLRWVEKEAQLHCTQCQGWGHLNFNCLSNIMRCSKCAGPHDYRQHDRYCELCKAGKGKLCIPKCHNCHGPHFANSKDCVFYVNRSSKERQVQLRDEFSQKWKEEAAALKAAANSDSGRAARTATAIQADKSKVSTSKTKSNPRTGSKNAKDNDEYVPVGKDGKAKFTFRGMASALASTTRIEEVPGEDGADEKSDASSELRLSYLDDIPLKKRFPNPKAPVPDTKSASKPALPSDAPASENAPKRLSITLPARSGFKPLRSVTDILRELRHDNNDLVKGPPAARFGGGEVEYSSSALAAEADAFATALADAGLPSQPSPPAGTEPLTKATSPHAPTNQHD